MLNVKLTQYCLAVNACLLVKLLFGNTTAHVEAALSENMTTALEHAVYLTFLGIDV